MIDNLLQFYIIILWHIIDILNYLLDVRNFCI